MEDSPKSVVTPAVEPRTMLSVACVFGDGNAGVREVLAEAENYSELAREQGAPPEIGNVLTQFFSPKELSSLVAHLVRATQPDNPAEDKVTTDVGARW